MRDEGREAIARVEGHGTLVRGVDDDDFEPDRAAGLSDLAQRMHQERSPNSSARPLAVNRQPSQEDGRHRVSTLARTQSPSRLVEFQAVRRRRVVADHPFATRVERKERPGVVRALPLAGLGPEPVVEVSIATCEPRAIKALAEGNDGDFKGDHESLHIEDFHRLFANRLTQHGGMAARIPHPEVLAQRVGRHQSPPRQSWAGRGRSGHPYPHTLVHPRVRCNLNTPRSAAPIRDRFGRTLSP